MMTEKQVDLLEKMMSYTVAKMNAKGKDKMEWFIKIQEIKRQLKEI